MMCQLVWNKANLHSNGVQGIRFQTFQSIQQSPFVKFDLWPVLMVLLFWVMVMVMTAMFMLSLAVWAFGVFGVFWAFVVVLVFLVLWHVHRDRHCGATDSCKTPLYWTYYPLIHLGSKQPCHPSPCPFLELTSCKCFISISKHSSHKPHPLQKEEEADHTATVKLPPRNTILYRAVK